MRIVSREEIKDKRVLLRLDLDVPVENGVVAEDFRLKAGLPTLKLCLENASKVIIIGHMGRPEKPDPLLSLKPVCEWFNKTLPHLPGVKAHLEGVFSLEQAQSSNAKILMLENIRFFAGETEGDLDFARKLSSLGDFFINEAFASHNPAISTTILPTLLPHAAGLRFTEEIRVLTTVRDNPKKPFVAVMGGAKVEDKLPVIEVLAKKADAVLVGGKLVVELTNYPTIVGKNVLVGKLTEDGLDMAAETIESWRPLIMGAATIVWNGPVGRFEDPKNDATKKIAEIILRSTGDIVIGGGDTIAALNQVGLLVKAQEKAFVSTGGGAMLKFLTKGSLPTIEALGI